jgi:hypothetical protein
LIIQRLTLLAVFVAAICCAVAIAAFVVAPPARKSAPVGVAAKADAPPVAHDPPQVVRTIPIIGKTTPLEVQPAPQSASVTSQEQEPAPSPKPDPSQRNRTQRADAGDPTCGEHGRHRFADRPRHRSWRCNR